jgi:hypothetical protein
MAAKRDAKGRFTSKPGRELSPAYRRRIERGVKRGRSLARSRGHQTRPIRQYESQAYFGRASYERVLQAASLMRRGKSLTRAAKIAGTTPDTIKRIAGTSLVRGVNGRFTIKAVDHLYRSMKFLFPDGMGYVEVGNSREASKLGRYMNALRHYSHTGDATGLLPFRRKRLRTRQKIYIRFVTDLKLIDRLLAAGELEFASIYKLVG